MRCGAQCVCIEPGRCSLTFASQYPAMHILDSRNMQLSLPTDSTWTCNSWYKSPGIHSSLCWTKGQALLCQCHQVFTAPNYVEQRSNLAQWSSSIIRVSFINRPSLATAIVRVQLQSDWPLHINNDCENRLLPSLIIVQHNISGKFF